MLRAFGRKLPVEPRPSWPYGAALLASADGTAVASVGGGDAVAGGGAALATAGAAFFTTGLAALGGAAGFAGSLPQKLNSVDIGAVSLTPPV